MRVILFQERFASLVEAGTKRQTIRKAARCKVGDVLSLRRWSGKPYRSKQVIIKQTVCTGISMVIIEERNLIFPYHPDSVKSYKEMNDFARSDGFSDYGEMADWFMETHGLPFVGEVIQWAITNTSGGRC